MNNFIIATEEKLKLLKKFPQIGYSSNQNKYLRKTLIGKRIILIYRFRPRENEIELVNFFNSWQNLEKQSKR